MTGLIHWQHLPVLQQLLLSLGLGLLLGLERQKAAKEIGLRTFAFASLIGTLSRMVSLSVSMVAVGVIGVIILILNLHVFAKQQGAEITTSAALLLATINGILIAMGHIFIPVTVTILILLLLSLKEELAGFTTILTKSEVNAAITFGILAFVILPVLPSGTVDPWGLIDLRIVWLTIVLLSAIAFANYILLRIYGARGFAYTGLLGGVINSTVTVTEMALKAKAGEGNLNSLVFSGIMLANAAMFIRNVIILAIFAPQALYISGLPFLVMIILSFILAWKNKPTEKISPSPIALSSPFSLRVVLYFGVIFLALTVVGGLAQRLIGNLGFYAVSLTGGTVSSASAIATAATLAMHKNITVSTAAVGAVLASITSCAVHFPMVWRINKESVLIKRLFWATVLTITVGVLALWTTFIISTVRILG
ncbi:MAG: MgtC/SapB family protein [Peptococcaceae bacterium]|jgi:uncharacterized membrane protein (DUF4010 family)|nr:MgtC/SapB family protein [Peptococcaceae bacterium]